MASSADRCKYCRKDLSFTSEFYVEKNNVKVCEVCFAAGKYIPIRTFTPKRKKK